jgi:MFS family permease
MAIPRGPSAYDASDMNPSSARARLTLALCVVLHAFTHAYAVVLVPLYLLITADLHLGGVKAAALIVTVYGIAYNALSFAAGTLADRFDRRVLLSIGLFGNAIAIGGMSLTHDYSILLLLGAMAGLFGTLFHPSANALVCAHFPQSPGMAIGLLGAGSGLGFFVGPQFAGWRAQHATWQTPCRELGIAGLVMGLVFLICGREAPHRDLHKESPRLGRRLSRLVVVLSAVLGWRDFAGVATMTLASIYLQRACGRTVQQAGFILGAMMLLGMVANPLGVYLSGGRRRLPALAMVCFISGIVIATTPFWPAAWALAPLCCYQTLQLGSYAISDAATLERVAPAVRGRVVGVFLSLAGTFSAFSPWCMGYWTDRLGLRATSPAGYVYPFAALGIMMWIAAFSPLVIRRFGEPTGEKPITIADEIMPRTMEGVA